MTCTTEDLAGDYDLAMTNLNHIRKQLAIVLKKVFGVGIDHCEIQDRTLIVHLKVTTIAEQFPKMIFECGFNTVIIKLSNGEERTWVDPIDTFKGVGP